MRQVLYRLKLGTLTLGGFALIVLGAAGYATFAEADHNCKKQNSTEQYISGIFIPEEK